MQPALQRTLLLASIALLLAGTSALAQHSTVSSTGSPVVIIATHHATIPSIVGATTGPVQPSSLPASPCANLPCYETTVTVRSNSHWQLQVLLRQPLANAPVEWLDSGSQFLARRLAPGVYQAVASGQSAAFDETVTLKFTARDTTTGVPVDASELGAILAYRVVALP